MINDTNPWRGLQSYREGDVLYGRDDDIRNLSWEVSAYTDFVLYGKSGIGKSSILNAGILPSLRRQGIVPVLIRLEHHDKPYVCQIRQAISEAGITIEDVHMPLADEETLWELMHCHRFLMEDGSRAHLELLFDQFEEIFTLQQNPQLRRRFFAELADLVNNVQPEAKTEKPVETTLVTEGALDFNFDAIRIDAEGGSAYVNDNRFHLLFTLREDYLSELEHYTLRIPSMRQHRYGLRPINSQQAREIILRPCPGLISEAVARQIIEMVVGHPLPDEDMQEVTVDSAVLSLYLNRLFEEHTGDTITSELVQSRGAGIIRSYYEDCVRDMPQDWVLYLEDHLINKDGHRENIIWETVLSDLKVTDQDLQPLLDAHLLRRFSLGGHSRLEFMHDVLCAVVMERRARRELDAQEERMRKENKRWRRTRWISLTMILLIIVAVCWIVNEVDNLQMQRDRLANMEQSVSQNIAKSKLMDGDIYGAMQLLVNSIDTTRLDSADERNAQYEKLLREAFDSLANSAGRCVARRQVMSWSGPRNHWPPFSVSRDGVLIAYQSEDAVLHICDASTFTEKFNFVPGYHARLRVADFTTVVSSVIEDMSADSTIYEYKNEFLVIQDDSIALLCSGEYNWQGTELILDGYKGSRVSDAAFMQDSLVVVEDAGHYVTWNLTSEWGYGIWFPVEKVSVAKQWPAELAWKRQNRDTVCVNNRMYFVEGNTLCLYHREAPKLKDVKHMTLRQLLNYGREILGPNWQYQSVEVKDQIINQLKY